MPPYRAGDTVEDLCRACKIDRAHTVIVAEPSGRPLRVQCDYCGSQHQFRGGGRIDSPGPSSARSPPAVAAIERRGDRGTGLAARQRARTHGGSRHGHRPATAAPSIIETLLRRIIREETGLTAVTPADKWRGGSLVLKPGNPALQDKSWPIETFFHKVVMIRNRLRTLEQQVNALDLPEDVKVKLQAYITGCYGSLTSFNVLFANEDDQFKGSGD